MSSSLNDLLLIPFNLVGTTPAKVGIPLIIFFTLLYLTNKYLIPKFPISKTISLILPIGIALIINFIPVYFNYRTNFYGYDGFMVVGKDYRYEGSDSFGFGWPAPIIKYYFLLQAIRLISNYLIIDLTGFVILFIIGFIYFGFKKEMKQASR